MLRNRSRQQSHAVERREGVRRTQRKNLTPPFVRSPALESVEEQQKQLRRMRGREQRNAVGRMRYEVESSVAQRSIPRKSLPRLKSAVPRVGSTNVRNERPLRVGLRERVHQIIAQTADLPRTPIQVISEEEQKKLEALEMRLPRVAGKIDPWLFVVVLMLLCIGLVMVYSASSFVSAKAYGDASYFFQRQLLWSFLGVIVMLVTMRVDYRKWRRFSLVGMLITLPLLVIVLVFGTNAYGASRWLAFGSFFSFQPSELTKLMLALYIADWLARKGNQVGTFLYGLAPFIILVGLILGLVLLENDMGTAMIIAGLATTMFFTAGANITQFLLAMGCGGLIFVGQAFNGYRYYRLMGFLNPFKNTTSINLQLYQSLLALGSGGFFGLGLGASRQKTGYLPLPHIDSIFAIIGEELGFLGCLIIILLFLFLAFRGFRLARRTQDIYGALLATGITTWLVLQAIINIGSTTGTIPYTGVPLPFISFGGSSLIISLAAVGVLLNISRYIQEPEKPVLSHTISFITGRRKV